MYIAVCDDQLEELNEILELLQLWQTENNTILRVRTFRSAVELVDAAQREHFTLYLLDVIMPGMDGLEAAPRDPQLRYRGGHRFSDFLAWLLPTRATA